MNKVNVYCFKKSGKYYTHEENVEIPKGMMLFYNNFDDFIRSNCGVGKLASYEFTIVVFDHKDNNDFYTCIL